MSTTDLVQKKVALLPQEIQLQVLDFVNFLSQKYEVEADETILEAFLLRRAQQSDKSKRISATDLRNNVLKKYSEDV